jgi:hypothetical protein
MLRPFLTALLIPLLLVPPGVCACHAGACRCAAVGGCGHDGDDCHEAHPDAPASPGPSHADEVAHPGPTPADHPERHAPSCPALKTVAGARTTGQGKLPSSPDSVTTSLPTVPPGLPSSARVGLSPIHRPPGRPLFLILRALLI